MKVFLKLLLIAVVFCFPAPVVSAGADVPTYRVTVVNPTGDNDLEYIGAFNDRGDFAGLSEKEVPVVKYADGTSEIVQPVKGHDTIEFGGINHHGDVAGYSYAYHGGIPGAVVVHFRGGTTTTIANPSYASNVGINDAGQVVGQGGTGDQRQGFVWSREVGLRLLPDLPGGNIDGTASSINNAGDIVGYGSGANNLNHGTLWHSSGGDVTDLGLLDPHGESVAFHINDRGQIVGYATISTVDHAAYWDANHLIHDLGLLPGQTASLATDINNSGYIIGGASSDHAADLNKGVLWTPDGTIHQLDQLIDPSSGNWTIVGAGGINDAGQILASAEIDEKYVNVILTPVPEPASGLVLAVAGTLISTGRRRHG